MFCRYCGKEIGNESEQKFCPYCGKGVDGNNQSSSFSLPSVHLSVGSKLDGKKILTCILMFIGFLGILLPTITLQVETMGLFDTRTSSATCSILDLREFLGELKDTLSRWSYGNIYQSAEDSFAFFQGFSMVPILIYIFAIGAAAYSGYALFFVKDEELFLKRAKLSTIASIGAAVFILIETLMLSASSEGKVGDAGLLGAKAGLMLYVLLVVCGVNIWLISKQQNPVRVLEEKSCPFCGEVYTLGDECPRCGKRPFGQTSSASMPSMAYVERRAEGKRCPKCDTTFVIGNNCPNCGAVAETIYAEAVNKTNSVAEAPVAPKVKTCCTCSERFTEGEACPICGSKIYSLK